jgi:hypothetical protein
VALKQHKAGHIVINRQSIVETSSQRAPHSYRIVYKYSPVFGIADALEDNVALVPSHILCNDSFSIRAM